MFGLSDIYVGSYELQFKPFAYKLSIEGQLEINSTYKIGTKILVGKMIWPNQIIDLIDIVPDKNQKCKNSTSQSCSVFKFHTYAQLSGDKYLSREFVQVERIPIKFMFDFNSDNLESFKSYNYTFKHPSPFQNQNERLSEYIASIKLLQINTHLNYKNSFVIDKGHKSENIKSIAIPTQWTIRNGVQTNTYKDIDIRFNNYRNLRNTYITDWFSIKTDGNIYLHDSNEVDVGSTYIQIPSTELKHKYKDGWSSYYLNGNLRKINNEFRYIKDHLNQGIFFGEEITGYLTSKFKLLINNHGYTITIKNPFSFKGKTIEKRNRFWNVYMEYKYDNYFQNLHKFKFFDL